MDITIDIDTLRHDLIDYFGSAMTIYPQAVIELSKVESATDREIVMIAIKNNFNLYDYEIKTKQR